VKVEAIQYGDRKVYTVASFNRGVADWLSRLPTIWVEGEVTELRRNPRWQSVFFTLKDPDDGACLGVTIARSRFDALRLDLSEGERVHVFGRPELFEAKGDFRMRALSLERFGLGDHLAALERLKKKLAAEGVFERKRPLPLLPRRIGIPLFIGIATHLFLDELGDVAGALIPALGTHGRPGTINAILFPLLGPHFPVSPYRSALEHALSLANGYVIAGEILGAVLLLWQWRAGVFEGLTRRARAEKAASGSTPSSP